MEKNKTDREDEELLRSSLRGRTKLADLVGLYEECIYRTYQVRDALSRHDWVSNNCSDQASIRFYHHR